MGFAAVGGTYVAMVGIEGFMKGRGRWRGFKERVRGAVKGKEGEEEGEEGVGKGVWEVEVVRKVKAEGCGMAKIHLIMWLRCSLACATIDDVHCFDIDCNE